MALTEPGATFTGRCKELDIKDDLVQAMATQGVKTLGSFAFAVVAPGKTAEGADVQAFVDKLISGRRCNLGELAALNRLVLESHTSLVAQLRADADPAAEPSTRKLPPGERAARLDDQRKRLVGLQIEGLGMRVQRTGPLRRDDGVGSVNVREAAPAMERQIHTELACQQAMQRRALAMDAVGLINFEIGVAWVNSLFSVMTQPVAPGFARISLVQLLRTDRVAFARMSELSRNGIRPTVAGARPLDNILKGMRDDSSVMFYMLPTLAMHAPPKRTWDEMAWGSKGKEVYGKGSKGKGGKGKAKGQKGPGKLTQQACQTAGKLPEALRKAGCVAMDNQGRRQCFGYNLDSDGCDQVQPGVARPRGHHLCARQAASPACTSEQVTPRHALLRPARGSVCNASAGHSPEVGGLPAGFSESTAAIPAPAVLPETEI